MARNTGASIAQDLLASLESQEGFSELRGRGYFAGVGHDGVIISPGESQGASDRRVILEVSLLPVITPPEAREVLRRLSLITEEDNNYRTLYLLLSSGEVTRGASELFDSSDVIVRSRRSFGDLCSQFRRSLSPNYEDPGLNDRTQQLI